MNPYQVMAFIASGTLAFALVVLALVSIGLPVLLAFGLVYLFALVSMVAGQRRARQSREGQQRMKRYRSISRFERQTSGVLQDQAMIDQRSSIHF